MGCARLALRSAVDHTMYWQVLIGQRKVLLARSSEFLLTELDGTVRRNASVFSNCREYIAESTVSFEASPATQVPPPIVEKMRVQPGLQLQLVLDRPLDANEAAIRGPDSRPSPKKRRQDPVTGRMRDGMKIQDLATALLR
jgi:hypothetical protein